jgi:uncharacterized membrane protein YhaH (DUF805 family)
MGLLTLLFDFRGRAGRAQFWLASAIWVVFFLVVVGLFMTTGVPDVVIAASLVVFSASAVAVGIKRLHDREKSSWWLLAFYGAPVLLSYVASLLSGGSDAALPASVQTLQFIWFAVVLWALVELGMIRGTIGINEYGADPLAPAPAPARMAH